MVRNTNIRRSGSETPLRELTKLFLKLGATAFGGPAVHIAMMEDEVVHRRGWMTSQEFLDLMGATNLIPGPNSTEMAIHIGYRRARMWGLLVAGLCFIVPAVAIVIVIAWAYVRFGSLPEAKGLLYGIKPVVIAVIAQALWRLGKSAIKSPILAAVFVVASIANFVGVDELVVLIAAAAFVAAVESHRTQRLPSSMPAIVLPAPLMHTASMPALGGAVAVLPVSLLPLFLIFLKIGSVLFGSGYVLIAFLRSDLVVRMGWLTESQLLDAVAIGQVTPGPIFTTATFIGYLVAGPVGALVATVGIFLPAFVYVAISAPLIPRLRSSIIAAQLLDGLNVASLALMAVVAVRLGGAALVDPITAIIALASIALLVRYNTNATWLIVVGGVIGIVAWSAQ